MTAVFKYVKSRPITIVFYEFLMTKQGQIIVVIQEADFNSTHNKQNWPLLE